MHEPDDSISNPSLMLRQIAARSSLFNAWRSVRANRGAAGVDAVSLEAFERRLDANLTELARNLLCKSYEPMPARQVAMPKPNGGTRELAIPTVRDRVVQRAVLDRIEPLFEPGFLDCSYAFRPGRSVEMAIQRIVVARARGFRWTADADIDGFFPSIDHRMLLDDLSRTINDPDVLRLIAQWLDAGALDGCRPSAAWISRLKSVLAGGKLALGDAIDSLLNEFVSNRLDGVQASGGDPNFAAYSDAFAEAGGLEPPLMSPGDEQTPAANARKAAIRRLLQDGLLLGLVERGALRALLSAKVLALGGAALVAAAAAPPLIRKLSAAASRSTGAMQGSPISPLLSNVYLHPFDVQLIRSGRRMIRYCDDFVILAASKSEAEDALASAEAALGSRRLRLSREKTRVVAPDEPLDFLGYRFSPDGRLVPPPSIPAVVARRMIAFAGGHASRASANLGSTGRKTIDAAAKVKDRLRDRLKDRWPF